jgi:predicted dehydrogenase
VVIVSTLANDYVTEPAIHGDEGTLTLQNPGEWNEGIDSVTIIPRKGERQVYPMQKGDATAAHWQDFLKCVRTRERPVSDVEFGLHVQTALNMAMLSLLKDKVVKFDFERKTIVM